MTSPVLKRIRAINLLRSHLTFLERKELGLGLVISKIQYCLEVTSCCPRYIFNKPKKLLNRLVRGVSGEWQYERTAVAFLALGWSRLEGLVILRSLLLAKKLLRKGDQPRILRSFAEEAEEGWLVKSIAESRTEIGRRSFASRVRRLWSVLPEEMKVIEIKSKDEKE